MINKPNKNNNFLRSVLLTLFVFSGVSPTVFADDDIERLFVFGDSLSDPGNAFILTGMQSVAPFQLIPDAPYARGGHHFTNGKTWVEQFAKKQDTKAKPAFLYNGSTNFAVGGSRARSVGQVNLTTQVGLYLNQFAGAMDEEDLFVIFIGGNDIRDSIVAFALDTTGQTSALIITEALTAIQDNLTLLINSGARNFMVANAPDLSLVPAIRLQGPQAQQVAHFFSARFNQGLAQLLAGIQGYYPVEITSLDVFALITDVVVNPDAYDMEEVLSACITPGVIAGAICDDKDEYLFWDGIHPTKKGHKLIARQALELIDDD